MDKRRLEARVWGLQGPEERGGKESRVGGSTVNVSHSNWKASTMREGVHTCTLSTPTGPLERQVAHFKLV